MIAKHSAEGQIRRKSLIYRTKKTIPHAGLGNRIGLSKMNWWRRRESNPRPQMLPSRIYMLSSVLLSYPWNSVGTWISKSQSVEDLTAWQTDSHQTASPLSRRPGSDPAGENRWDGSMTGIKLLLRSYNRLRLYLKIYWFYEPIVARHATMSLHIPVEAVSPPFLLKIIYNFCA